MATRDADGERVGELPVLHPVVGLPVLGIVAAEALLLVSAANGAVSPTPALVVHLLTMCGCVLAPVRWDEYTGVLFTFALLPLFRLVNLGLPTLVEPALYQVILVYALVVPAAVLVTRVPDVATLDLGRARSLLLAPFGVVVGGILAVGEYYIIQPPALVPAATSGQLFVLALVMVGIVGLVEEWVFRGLLQGTLVGVVGTSPGIIVSGVVFGAMHSQYGSLPEVVFATGIGLVFGLLYERTESLVLAALTHGTLNVVLFGVLPFYAA